jgi:hypothetical protein
VDGQFTFENANPDRAWKIFVKAVCAGWEAPVFGPFSWRVLQGGDFHDYGMALQFPPNGRTSPNSIPMD